MVTKIGQQAVSVTPEGGTHLSPDLAAYRVVGAAEAATLINVSLAHFRRLYRTGKVPAPIKISDRKLGWRVGTLLGLIDAASNKEAA